MRDTNWEFKLFLKLPLRKHLRLKYFTDRRLILYLQRGNITKPFQMYLSTKILTILPKSSTKSKMGNFAKNVEANSTQCSQAVTHPSTDLAQCCLTSVIGRELVYSTWYGRWQGHKKISQTVNATTHSHIWDFAHRLGWNVVGLNLDYFYNYPLASWAFPALSLKPLFPCFEHSNFYARHMYCKDKAEICNLSKIVKRSTFFVRVTSS